MQTEWRPESITLAQAFAEHARARGVSAAQLAIAWVLNNRTLTGHRITEDVRTQGGCMGELIRIAGTADVKPGAGMVAEVNGKAIAVFNVDGAFYAIDNTCVHRGGPLGEGDVEGDVVSFHSPQMSFSSIWICSRLGSLMRSVMKGSTALLYLPTRVT